MAATNGLASGKVGIPYAPRRAFLPFHARKQRWACLVAHRRAGKTVSAINDTIKAAVTSVEKNPLFGYVAPFRSQAKAVAWGYLKQYAQPIAAATNESELSVTLINGAKISLYGADNADAMRGLGFSGVYMDEYGDFRPSVWGNVIRPALSDHQGWGVFAGTPKGKNQFWTISETAKAQPAEWYRLELRASTSSILPEAELKALRAQLSDDQYAQEYECSFDAAILGAFYGVELCMATESGRVGVVPYDPAVPVYTAWDLGFRDDTAIWWYQVVRNEVHVIDFVAVSGLSVLDIATIVLKKPYSYGKHYLPHDARAKTLAAAGRSIIEQLSEHLGMSNLVVVAELSVQDGIQAVRAMLPRCWFDAERCADGIEALRQYQREYDEDKKAFRLSPLHNFASHPADAFRMLALAWRGKPEIQKPEPMHTLIVGPDNRATLNDMWALHKTQSRVRV